MPADPTVKRRSHLCIRKAKLGLSDRRLGRSDAGLGGREVSLLGVELLLRQRTALNERFRSLDFRGSEL